MIELKSGQNSRWRSYSVGSTSSLDLIQAIQSYKPIPEASEIYFRRHIPDSPEKTTSLFGELSNIGRSDSPSGSSQNSSSSSTAASSDWSWDLDKFFSKLFGGEESQAQPQQRAQPQSNTRSSQPPPRPYPQQQQRPPNGSTYRPQASPQRPTYAPPNTPPTNGYRPAPASASYRPPAHHAPPSTSTNTSTAQGQHYHRGPSPASTSTPPPRQPATSAPPPRSAPIPSPTPPKITLDQIMSTNAEPSTLSIKTIKTLLDDSCVSYVGVVEKKDLVDRLQKLIDNTKAERDMVETESKKSTPSASASNDDDNLCKICCDASLNCVMLNCNHMSTCMDCGKLILEGSRMCPICREYVVRLLHVFRA